MPTRIIFIAFISLLVVQNSLAQETFEESLPTNKVDKNVNDDAPGNRPVKRKIAFIYTKKANKNLVGNPCAILETHKWGFEYVQADIYHSGWRRFRMNFGPKTKLFFTKGPWWKATMNKRIKRCAQLTGDRPG